MPDPILHHRDQKALILVEAKLSGTNPDDSLRFFERFGYNDAFYDSMDKDHPRISGGKDD
jgi:hypothetical protein